MVALDPNTGKILAMASSPSFTATNLASHKTSTAAATYKKLNTDPDQPLLNRAMSDDVPARIDIQGRRVGGGPGERAATRPTR